MKLLKIVSFFLKANKGEKDSSRTDATSLPHIFMDSWSAWPSSIGYKQVVGRLYTKGRGTHKDVNTRRWGLWDQRKNWSATTAVINNDDKK